MLKYRPEIDGLRAIAILSVFFFHLEPDLVPGGFIGVDVFFVISGYLISSGLLFNLAKNNKIDFKEFYSRRIRRIIPSLLLIVVVSFLLGCLFMLPNDLYTFARSGIAALTFSSNRFFSKSVDYFAPTSDEFPLLHTWSLAIEEQFYILWPLMLALLWKIKSKRGRLLTWIFLILSSIAASYFMTKSIATKDVAYFSLFTRGHELLIGCLIAFIEQNYRFKLSAKISTPTAFISLIALLSTFWLIDLNSNFPGLLTLIPCIATALIIYSCHCQEKSPFKTLMSSKVLTYIGQHSYPIYLWHWPLLSFYRYTSGKSYPGHVESLIYIGVTLFLSILTKKFFEVPLYQVKFTFKQSFVRYLLVPGLVCGAVLHVTKKTDGLPQRISQIEEYKIETNFQGSKFCEKKNIRDCNLITVKAKAPKVLLFGDSFAGHFQAFWLESLTGAEVNFYSRSRNSCPPLLYQTEEMKASILRGSSRRCPEHLADVAKNIDHFDVVIIAGNWARYKTFFKGFDESFKKTLDILEAKKKPTVVMAQIPTLDNFLYFSYIRAKYAPVQMRSLPELKNRISTALKKTETQIKGLIEGRPQFLFFEVPIKSAFSGDVLVYRDGSHLNHYGSRSIALSQKVQTLEEVCHIIGCKI